MPSDILFAAEALLMAWDLVVKLQNHKDENGAFLGVMRHTSALYSPVLGARVE